MKTIPYILFLFLLIHCQQTEQKKKIKKIETYRTILPYSVKTLRNIETFDASGHQIGKLYFDTSGQIKSVIFIKNNQKGMPEEEYRYYTNAKPRRFKYFYGTNKQIDSIYLKVNDTLFKTIKLKYNSQNKKVKELHHFVNEDDDRNQYQTIFYAYDSLGLVSSQVCYFV